MSSRYDRQIAMFGSEGQARIAAAQVVVVGVGGLGSYVVQQLAYLGIRRFINADADVVDETNLNRLIGATPNDVGRQKVAVCGKVIRSVTAVP